jgi:hypothetical protein
MDYAGIRKLLKEPFMVELVQGYAKTVKSSAESMSGCTYKAKAMSGKKRAIAIVKTTDIKSIRSNLKNNTLLKALNAAKR